MKRSSNLLRVIQFNERFLRTPLWLIDSGVEIPFSARLVQHLLLGNVNLPGDLQVREGDGVSPLEALGRTLNSGCCISCCAPVLRLARPGNSVLSASQYLSRNPSPFVFQVSTIRFFICNHNNFNEDTSVKLEIQRVSLDVYFWKRLLE